MSRVRTDERADPWQPPAGPLALEVAETHPGLNRRTWVRSTVAWTILWLIVTPILIAAAKPAVSPLLLSIAWGIVLTVFATVHLWFVSRRLLHVGYPPWFALMALLPGANLGIGFLCLIAPAGYARHRTLDRAGRILAGLCLVGAVLLILSVLW